MKLERTISYGTIVQLVFLIGGGLYFLGNQAAEFRAVQNKVNAVENQLLLWLNKSEDNQKKLLSQGRTIEELLRIVRQHHPETAPIPTPKKP